MQLLNLFKNDLEYIPSLGLRLHKSGPHKSTRISYQSGTKFGHEPVFAFSSDAIFPDAFLDSVFFLLFYDLF